MSRKQTRKMRMLERGLNYRSTAERGRYMKAGAEAWCTWREGGEPGGPVFSCLTGVEARAHYKL